MLRHVLSLLLWPLLGAAATYAVAWSASLWAAGGFKSGPPITPAASANLDWPAPVPADWTYPTSITEYGFHGGALTVASHAAPPFRTCTLEVFRSGWPWRALTCSRRTDEHAGKIVQTWHAGGGVDRDPPTEIPRSLPLKPLWRGFLLDTFFYTAIAWLLWRIPVSIRRRLWREHFRCIHCGYNIATLPDNATDCPECGRTVKSRVR